MRRKGRQLDNYMQCGEKLAVGDPGNVDLVSSTETGDAASPELSGCHGASCPIGRLQECEYTACN